MSHSFIDKYEIVSTIGRGSMGVVYKAKDPEIGRLVAIKTLKAVFMGDDTAGNEALQRFRQESRSAGRLHHPNIVTIFEAGRASNGSPFIVMEYIEGKSLESMMAENGAIDPLAVLHYLSQIANAIDYAHAQDVIHRDIKPSNIIITSKHKPFLLDFGVAKISDTSLTPAGTVVGTPSYMSPEQIRGSQLDGRSDIFSLAVVAYEAFTGKRPFPGSDFTTVVSSIINKEPLTFKDVESNLPAALEKVLHKGMSKEKTERQQSALELIDEAAQTLGVVVDGNGLIGGYYPGMLVEDHQKSSNISQRVKAKTVLSSFTAESIGLKAALEEKDRQDSSANHPVVDRPKMANASKQDELQETTRKAFNVPNENLTAKKSPAVKIFAGIVVLILIGIGVFTSKPELIDQLISSADTTSQESDISEAKEDSVVETKKEEKPLQQIVKTQEETNTLPAGPYTAEKIATLNIAQLTQLLNTEKTDKNVIQALLNELKNRGKYELMPIALRNPDYKIRIDVLKVIASLDPVIRENLIDTVVVALNEDEFLVRGFAVKVLTQIKTKKSLSALEARQLIEKNQIVLKVLNDGISQMKSNSDIK